jgi:hypothetical protein
MNRLIALAWGNPYHRPFNLFKPQLSLLGTLSAGFDIRFSLRIGDYLLQSPSRQHDGQTGLDVVIRNDQRTGVVG